MVADDMDAAMNINISAQRAADAEARKFTLEALPPGLCLNIYRLLLVPGKRVAVDHRAIKQLNPLRYGIQVKALTFHGMNGKLKRWMSVSQRHGYAILRTNRTVYDEAADVLY